MVAEYRVSVPALVEAKVRRYETMRPSLTTGTNRQRGAAKLNSISASTLGDKMTLRFDLRQTIVAAYL
jgi:hypothetical protein